MTARTKAAMQAEIATNILDNTTGQITPAIMRTTLDDMVDSYVDTVNAAPNSIKGNNTTSTAQVSDITSIYLKGSVPSLPFGQGPILIENGGPQVTYHENDENPYFTAAAGGVTASGANTITVPSTTGVTKDYIGSVVTITAGTDVGDVRQITNYNAGTKTLTVGVNWTVPPDATSAIAIGRIDYGWWRIITDANAMYFETWEQPLGTQPFAAQDEFLSFQRYPTVAPFAADHVITMNYQLCGRGNRDWSIAANYQDIHVPQTARNLSLMALNTGNNGLQEAMRLVPNGASPYFWTPTGINLGIGTGAQPTCALEVRSNASAAPGSLPTGSTIAHFVGANASNVHIVVDTFASNGEHVVRRANGNAGAPSNLAIGDAIGAFSAYGYGATAYSTTEQASINFSASENWTDAAHGCRISFGTTPNGSTVQANRMNIYESGGVSINNGNDPGTGNLSVTGKYTATDKLEVYTATAPPAGGTAGVGILLSSTANLGIFFGSGVPSLNAAQGSIYLRTDGAKDARLYINTNGTNGWTAFVTAA